MNVEKWRRATERIGRDRARVIASIAAYAETDLLCYRAAAPEMLRKRQDAAWQPWLDWAALRFDALLLVTSGIVHIAQPAPAIAALTGAVARASDQELAVLEVVVPATGSLVLGLALLDGAIGAAELHEAASVDERFQAEFWGADEEAEVRLAGIGGDIAVAERFLASSRERSD